MLYARISFDREKYKLYEVPIAAFDGGGRPGYSTVRISVTNDNDNAPLFAVSEYRAYVYENTTIGTTVLQVIQILREHSFCFRRKLALFRNKNFIY